MARREELSENLDQYRQRAAACRAAAEKAADEFSRHALVQAAECYELLATVTQLELADPLWAA
jgi:hypothetical protein